MNRILAAFVVAALGLSAALPLGIAASATAHACNTRHCE